MLLRILDRLEETLIATMIGGATLIIFLSVVQRFAAGVRWLYPIASQFDMDWAQELCIFMFIWMAKFGAAYGVRTGIHVGVDVLVKRLEPRRQKAVILFGLMCGVLFTGVIGSMGAEFVYGLMGTDQTTPDLEWPSWIVYLCIPLGSYLMCFRFLQVAWHFWKTGEVPHHDAGHVEGLPELDAKALDGGARP